ncbi:MAG TPA: hypothetical protein VGS57_17550 [Thermoanaerobaculia bacterium]|jgi:drug/metabolite transporter (DMT)-like permease|nr:hypothetical protein [Thermoanaerobaculia bacterium]
MSRFRTSRERLLWMICAGVVLAIYASAYFVQLLLQPLRDRGLLGAAIWGTVIVASSAGIAFLVRQRPRRWEVALLFAAAGAYLLFLRHLDIIQERLHLVEYGVVGGLAYAALCERWAVDRAAGVAGERPRWQRWPAAWAILIATAAGWGDELVQALLPNRYYDLRDVATNAEAAALLVAVLAARRKLRAKPIFPPDQAST